MLVKGGPGDLKRFCIMQLVFIGGTTRVESIICIILTLKTFIPTCNWSCKITQTSCLVISGNVLIVHISDTATCHSSIKAPISAVFVVAIVNQV